MNCCKESNEPSTQSIPFPVSSESKQWLIMMKYMLECAEKSMEFLDTVKNHLDFNDEDLERFSILCIALEQARHQMALLGKKFFEDSSTDLLENLSILSEPKESKTNDYTQTGYEGDNIPIKEPKPITEKKEPTKKDACLCGAFKQRLVKKSKHEKIVVCSPLKRSTFVNEKCLKDGTPSTKKKVLGPEDYPNDDNNPYILKDSGRVDLPETGFGYELFYAMQRHRNKIAQIVETTDESQTYEELLRDTISCALNMKNKGMDEDCLVSLLLTNNKYTCMPYLAGLFLGCKMNGIDISFGKADIAFLLKLATPDLLFIQMEKVSIVAEALAEVELEIPIVVIGGDVEGYESFQDYLIAPDEDIKAFRPYKVDSMTRITIILFSSGTSGLPKGICLNHANMLGQVFFSAITDCLFSVFLSFTSYYWISAVILLGYTTCAGLTRIVSEPFHPIRFFQLIDRYKIEATFLGPFECIMVMRTPKPPDVDTSTLKLLGTGGAALREIVFIALRQIFPNCLVFQGYGQTEVGGLLVKWATKDPEDLALLHVKPSSCGRTYGGFWYKFVDEENDRILGPFQLGELCVKSDILMMNGYYKRDSSECFDRTGWLKTGDLAYYDDYHCIYVVDRVKELIKYRGWHVPPIIPENALMAHPAVARAVVVGIPHSEDGEHPMGLIILKDGVDPESVDLEEVAEFANSKLNERQYLRAGVRIIHSIPLTATGKVRRRSLRDSVLQGHQL
ncbi:luciferin 4-monooxygenase-like isoform X2 [Harmonia axyridis]|uniref:luciferin 4-monooxygenase-like isoform X1 n=1 Tax=Harmonia axyridis TaxID=115357 RepID=UPI001E275F05|nr:luciferin 4-monooxygenase-like isoform X1 [Harmonia axyridis]XP_045473076.1 luciferin 4-monooxygenase-like isoform X2 [Harmonia axyridis]